MDPDFSEFEICFCVREYDGQPVQYLSIRPIGFLGPQNALRTGGLIRVDIKIVVLRSHVIMEDHLTVSDFDELCKFLIKCQSRIAGSETFVTQDETFELSLSWREETQDILFEGKMPASEYADLTDNPLQLREDIYRHQSFQFALDPVRTLPIIAKLQALLNLIDVLSTEAE